jgi:hypothetical protein
MRRPAALLAAALVLGGAATLSFPGAAAAQPPPTSSARLQGTFRLAGRITVAVNVFGERLGQPITRFWTFTPQCPSGPCRSVLLTRRRARRTDRLLLIERSPGHYTGRGRFYAPLRCSGRIYRPGEVAPYMISVRVTTAIVSADGTVVAGRISATYTNPRRTNLTPCVEPPSHDAATYHGHII